MTDLLRVLGQADPSAGVLTDLYTVPPSTQVATGSITVCNRNTFSIKFRVAISIGGAADTPKQYIYYDAPLDANDTFIATIGVTLANLDVIRVRSDMGGVSFNAWGVEVT